MLTFLTPYPPPASTHFSGPLHRKSSVESSRPTDFGFSSTIPSGTQSNQSFSLPSPCLCDPPSTRWLVSSTLPNPTGCFSPHLTQPLNNIDLMDHHFLLETVSSVSSCFPSVSQPLLILLCWILLSFFPLQIEVLPGPGLGPLLIV